MWKDEVGGRLNQIAEILGLWRRFHCDAMACADTGAVFSAFVNLDAPEKAGAARKGENMVWEEKRNVR